MTGKNLLKVYMVHYPKMIRRAIPIVAGVALVLAGSCARLGTPLTRVPLPPGAPEVEDILADLFANDVALTNFRAAGTFVLESPKLEAIQKFPTGSVAFRKPADLYVVGYMQLGVIAFRLKSSGPEFLIEFPTKRKTEERYYYQLEGEEFESVPFSVSPSDIAREMFLPEDWAEIRRRQVRLIGYNEARQEAMLTIGPARRPERRLVVAGAPWVIVLSERLGDGGEVIARTTLADYHEVDGIRFPSHVDAWFPGEQTRMTFDMRNIRVNTTLDDDLFTIDWRLPDVHRPDTDESRGNRGSLKP